MSFRTNNYVDVCLARRYKEGIGVHSVPVISPWEVESGIARYPIEI